MGTYKVRGEQVMPTIEAALAAGYRSIGKEFTFDLYAISKEHNQSSLTWNINLTMVPAVSPHRLTQ